MSPIQGDPLHDQGAAGSFVAWEVGQQCCFSSFVVEEKIIRSVKTKESGTCVKDKCLHGPDQGYRLC